MFVIGDADKKCLPVFTDRDLVSRFLGASDGMEESVIVEIESQTMLLDMLSLAKAVAASVVFDPPKAVGWSQQNWPIDCVVKQIQGDLGLL